MDLDAPPAPRDADAPFSPRSNEQNPPDLILQTSDNVRFYVHWAILRFASPFFNDLSSLPSPTGPDANPTHQGKPVVSIPESSIVTEKLLRLCYPRLADAFKIVDLEGVDGAYGAARKYMVTGGTAQLESFLVEPEILKQHARRVYAIACHYGLEDIAKTAAIASLPEPVLHEEEETPPPEYSSISAVHLWRLQTFQRRCARTLESALDKHRSLVLVEIVENSPLVQYNRVWWASGGHSDSCGPEILSTYIEPVSWFRQHLKALSEQAGTHPDVEGVLDRLHQLPGPIMRHVARCRLCSEFAAKHLHLDSFFLRVQLKEALVTIAAETQFTGA
ncbi:hypothetical protein MKEN_01455300 [Mycena kentingensis (nom. inval.)]|nr:hypothetical protein MKEN_01455300 [Mycena kentingensis (nom. inval.)]